MIKEVVDGLISTHHISYYGGLFALSKIEILSNLMMILSYIRNVIEQYLVLTKAIIK